MKKLLLKIILYWLVLIIIYTLLFIYDYKIAILILILNIIQDYRMYEIMEYAKLLRKYIENKK
jgi:hypothetical protein